MRRHLLPVLAFLALAVCGIDEVRAQCAFEHPKKAKKFQSSLTTAFIQCGGLGFPNSPDTTTEGGVPSCKPPETWSQSSGNPPNGWAWDELKGQGQVQFKSAAAVPPVTPADSMDVVVKLKLKGVVNNNFLPGSGDGSLRAIARVTLDDRASGDMTIVDFPAAFPFTMADGRVVTKTSVDALLNDPIHQPGLPHCSSLELLYVAIADPAGDEFASAGLFLK